tara:strand:+ start:10500 stop:11516 length:1017 start_codon:yes stop_codon:yes gene_type:complete
MLEFKDIGISEKNLNGIVERVDGSILLNIRKIASGRNNRSYCLCTRAGHEYFLKVYFKHPKDTRERLMHEWAFLRYAKKTGIKNVADPIWMDENLNVGVYTFLKGDKITSDDIDDVKIQSAMDFVLRLNQSEMFAEAKSLPNASDACFTPNDHIRLLKTRLSMLNDLPAGAEVFDRAVDFVNEKLLPKADFYIFKAQNYFSATLDDVFCEVISPSDFGYHNSMFSKGGDIFYFDFEYAGRDGIEKLICDFFCQPRFPVSNTYLRQFCVGLESLCTDGESVYQRVEVLYPLVALKWCCIVLNEFLPVSMARRHFSDSEVAIENQLLRQLQLAHEMLNKF